MWCRLTNSFVSDPNIEAVFARLKETGRFDGEGLDAFLRLSPAVNADFPSAPREGPAESLEHGIAIRLLLPHPEVRFSHLKLDGHDIRASDVDGYVMYHNPGTIVQVNIPPGEVRDFHVVTGVFESDADRPAGFQSEDWSP